MPLGDVAEQHDHVGEERLHLRDARGVTLRDCTVRWGPNPPASYGPALDAERVEDLRVEGFQGLDAHPPPAAGTAGG